MKTPPFDCPKSPGSRSFVRAFTLIEVLTVVVIVLILAALLIPVVKNATLAGKQTSSLQRLRSIQMANIQYAGDHDGKYVPSYATIINSSGTGTDFVAWFTNSELLIYLVPNPQNYWWGNPHKALCSDLIPYELSKTMPTSFGINADGVDYTPDEWGNWNPIPRRAPNMPHAGKMMAFAESQDWAVTENACTNYTVPEKQTTNAVAYRYHNKANVAFFDGHVEQLTKEEIKKNTMLWTGN